MTFETSLQHPYPRLAFTPGEPAGIGPDICLKVASQQLPFELVVVGSATLLEERAKLINVPLKLYEFDPNNSPRINGNHQLAIVDIPLEAPCKAGVLSEVNSYYVLKTLQKAYDLCAQKQTAALVTGPIHKAIIQQCGIPFSGHTEYLADLAKVKSVLMTFHTPQFLVGMLTTHIPLNKVSSLVTPEKLNNAIDLLYNGLVNVFKNPEPRIKVLGLNPHAGENGILGKEEQTVMTPIIKTWQQKGLHIEGPLSGDTAFIPANRQNTDAFLAGFHDQGIAPIKALYFGKIVNITLGLPFLRGSVDHGTALSLAGTGSANESSLRHALSIVLKTLALPQYA